MLRLYGVVLDSLKVLMLTSSLPARHHTPSNVCWLKFHGDLPEYFERLDDFDAFRLLPAIMVHTSCI